MNKEDILKAIGLKYSVLSSECQNELLSHVNLLSVEKEEIVAREGQRAHKAYFIIDGSARAYYLKEGKDITDWFAFENEFISPIVSFFGDQVSPHYIEFLQASLAFEVSRESVEKLSQKHHDFERLIRIVVTEVMLSQRQRSASTLFQTAEQRYLHMMATQPHIIQRVPLTHIASYLGMTLETLSRVRKVKR